MRINLTDKFLLDLYESLDETRDVVGFLFSNRYKQARMLLGDGNPVFTKWLKDKKRRKFTELINYCKRKGYIKIANLQGKQSIMLTKSGVGKAFKANFGFKKQRKRQDGKWIMIIFDIPQKHSRARNLLRSVLENLGYKMFQQSVWVSPYDVFEKTEKSLQFYSLDRYVRILLVEKM